MYTIDQYDRLERPVIGYQYLDHVPQHVPQLG
jgi:hypothetical protein